MYWLVQLDPESSNHTTDSEATYFCLDFRMLSVWSVNDCFELMLVLIAVFDGTIMCWYFLQRVHFGRRHSPNVYNHWFDWYCLCRLLCYIVTNNVAMHISACNVCVISAKAFQTMFLITFVCVDCILVLATVCVIRAKAF